MHGKHAVGAAQLKNRCRNHPNPHARNNASHNGVVRSQLNNMLRLPPVGPKPVHQPVPVGTPPLKSQHGLAPYVARRMDGRMLPGGNQHQPLSKCLHSLQPFICGRINHKYRIQPVFQNIPVQGTAGTYHKLKLDAGIFRMQTGQNFGQTRRRRTFQCANA